MNRRQRERKRKQAAAKLPKPETIYGEEVGLILGIMHNGVPRLPAMQAWARAVPKRLRRAGRVVRIV